MVHVVRAVLRLVLICLAVKGSPEEEALSAATSEFSQRLYSVLSPKKNIIYSPYSISSVLAMASLGARGETAVEILNTLGLTFDRPHEVYHELIMELNDVQSVSLETANAVFVNAETSMAPEFADDAAKKYFGYAGKLESNDPWKKVNDFVARKTNNNIKDLLKQGSISPNSSLLLVDTVFFNGTWHAPFDTFLTDKRKFTMSNGAINEVDMMHSVRSIRIKRDDSICADVAELLFLGKRFGLYIVLPRQYNGITALENHLSKRNAVNDLFEGLQQTRLMLGIPKFKIVRTFDLKKQLQILGINRAFDGDIADFSGISPDEVFINGVLHKAVIDVQETGTVASAATLVEINSRSLIQESFVADHPFIFFLRDSRTGEILFHGRFAGLFEK